MNFKTSEFLVHVLSHECERSCICMLRLQMYRFYHLLSFWYLILELFWQCDIDCVSFYTYTQTKMHGKKQLHACMVTSWWIWFNSKTTNKQKTRCCWLVGIEYVFVSLVICSSPTYFTFLASRSISTNLHWSCCCTAICVLFVFSEIKYV